MKQHKSYPNEENLGRDCIFWQGISPHVSNGLAAASFGCQFPKAELQGRRSCEGVVDEPCLFIKDGRVSSDMSPEQMTELRRGFFLRDNRDIPPADLST